MFDETQRNMVRFAVIASSGQIIRMGVTPDFMVAAQAEEGEIALDVTDLSIADDTHYYLGGAFVEFPQKPGDWAKFDFSARVWIDPRTTEDHAAELEAKRADAIRQINNAIGKIRTRFVTVLPAQEMLYQAKEAEAKAYLTDPAPIASEYPFIHAEIGITGQDAWQVAQVYVNQALILRHTAAQLETVRLGHIAMVEAATEVGAVEAALSSFNQVVEAL